MFMATYNTNGDRMGCHTAARCPPGPRLPGTVEIHPRADKLSKAVYTCLPGSVFPGGKREYTTACNGTNWDPLPRYGCAGTTSLWVCRYDLVMDVQVRPRYGCAGTTSLWVCRYDLVMGVQVRPRYGCAGTTSLLVCRYDRPKVVRTPGVRGCTEPNIHET